jgi:hypothetical protein
VLIRSMQLHRPPRHLRSSEPSRLEVAPQDVILLPAI